MAGYLGDGPRKTVPREIVWLPGAIRDIARLRGFIEEKNSIAARRAANRIKQAAQILRQNPKVGKRIEEAPLFRELIIPFGNSSYVMRYREQEDRVVVVRVRHSREDG